MARARAAVALFALLLVVIGGGAWWLLDRESRCLPKLPPLLDSSRTERPGTARRDGALEDAVDAPPDDDGASTAQRAAVDRSPLELPADDELAALESRGRLLLAGRVIDFDGAPCPDAVLWHRGAVIGRSDAEGRYRVEVDRLGWWVRGSGASEALAAVKEGVGSGAIDVGDVSRQVDLPLQWRARFGGTTVEIDTDRLVPDATVELLAFDAYGFPIYPIFRLTTRSDANGAFEFLGVPPHGVALRAESESHASAGWFSCDTRDGEDHLAVPFRMMRRVHVRGWFVPPPPAGARLVLLPDLQGEVARELEKFEAAIDGEGRFDFQVAASMDCGVRLQIDDAPLWSGKFEVPIDAFEVDLGRIEVAEPGALEVEVSLPDEVLELGLEVRLQTGRHEFGELRRPIGRDGRARIERLAPCAYSLQVVFGSWYSLEQDELPPLLPGETRRWRLAGPEAGELWIVGRVTDPDGTPAVGVDLRMLVPYEGAAYELRAGAISDAAGRFALVAEARGADAFVAPGRSIELLARGRRGVRHLEVASALPAAGAVRRLDVVLEPGARLAGRVVNAAGAPVGDVALTIAPAELAAEDVRFFAIDFIAANDGTFRVDGLEARDHRVWLDTRRGRIEVGRIERAAIVSGSAPVTLNLPANWNE